MADGNRHRRSGIGAVSHYLNALGRSTCGLSSPFALGIVAAWLGLCIPLLLMLHVTSTRIAESLLGVTSHYNSVLIVQWLLSPWLGVLQATAVLTVWIHACLGVHFWLRTKAWYAHWRPLSIGLALLLPTLALSGYVAAGNQVLRDANSPQFVRLSLEESNLTERKRAEIGQIARVGSAAYLALVLVPFFGRGLRGWLYRRRQRPLLTHSSGRTVPILPGATVLETLRKTHFPCVGLRRTSALHHLPDSSGKGTGQASRANGAGIGSVGTYQRCLAHGACSCPPPTSLSCRSWPRMPVLPMARSGGLEGSERLITVAFVNLSGSAFLPGQAAL